MGSNYNNTDKAGVFNTSIGATPDGTGVNFGFRAASQHLLLMGSEASASVQILVNSTEYKKDALS